MTLRRASALQIRGTLSAGALANRNQGSNERSSRGAAYSVHFDIVGDALHHSGIGNSSHATPWKIKLQCLCKVVPIDSIFL